MAFSLKALVLLVALLALGATAAPPVPQKTLYVYIYMEYMKVAIFTTPKTPAAAAAVCKAWGGQLLSPYTLQFSTYPSDKTNGYNVARATSKLFKRKVGAAVWTGLTTTNYIAGYKGGPYSLLPPQLAAFYGTKGPSLPLALLAEGRPTAAGGDFVANGPSAAYPFACEVLQCVVTDPSGKCCIKSKASPKCTVPDSSPDWA